MSRRSSVVSRAVARLAPPAIALLVTLSPAAAQVAGEAPRATARPVRGVADSAASPAGDRIPMVTGRELGTAAALVGLTGALIPLDEAIVETLRRPALQASSDFRRAMVGADLYGAGVAAASGPALAVLGRLTGRPAVVDAGIHITEATLVASAVGFVAKGLAGRRRPYWPPWDRPTDFALGRGFPHNEAYSAFPAGHALAIYAFASVATIETGRVAPRYQRPVAVLVYGAAVVDAVSRVYRDTHWASDVAASAVIGTMSGLLITRHQHARPTNRVDRWARRLLLVPIVADRAGPRGGRAQGVSVQAAF